MLENVRLSAQAQVLCNLMEKYGVKCEANLPSVGFSLHGSFGCVPYSIYSICFVKHVFQNFKLRQVHYYTNL